MSENPNYRYKYEFCPDEMEQFIIDGFMKVTGLHFSEFFRLCAFGYIKEVVKDNFIIDDIDLKENAKLRHQASMRRIASYAMKATLSRNTFIIRMRRSLTLMATCGADKEEFDKFIEQCKLQASFYDNPGGLMKNINKFLAKEYAKITNNDYVQLESMSK